MSQPGPYQQRGDRRHFATAEEFEEFRDRIHEPYRWTFGEWSFDWLERRVQPGNVSLSPQEADILRALLESLTVPLSAKELAQRAAVYDRTTPVRDENVKTMVHRIRDKVGPEYIWSNAHAGYLFVPFPSKEQQEEGG